MKRCGLLRIVFAIAERFPAEARARSKIVPQNPDPTSRFPACLVSEAKCLRRAACGGVSESVRGAAPLALHGVGGWRAPGELTEGMCSLRAQSALAMREWVDWRATMEWLRGLVYL